MNIFNLGIILDTIGKVFIGLSVFMVHRHIYREHKVDADVLKAIGREGILTILGISFIIIGVSLQLIFH